MKTINFAFLVIFLFSCAVCLDAKTRSYPSIIQYIHPLPHSNNVMPQTNIAVRLEEEIDRSTFSERCYIVSGNHSGLHNAVVSISDDGRTILITPGTPFRTRETVTVNLTAGLRTLTGKTLQDFSFTFTISPDSLQQETSISRIEREMSEAFRASSQSDAHSTYPAEQLKKDKFIELPKDFPALTVSTSTNPSPGNLFLSNAIFSFSNIVSTPYLMIVDNTCAPVFYREMESICFDFKVQPNGLLTYWSDIFSVLDSTYTLIKTIKCKNGYATDPHELQLLPNGHALLMGFDIQTVDMSSLVAGGNPSAGVIGVVIQELDSDNNVVFQWRSFDHINITDATHMEFTNKTIDAVHGNALELDSDGNILLSSRHLDEITKIDRQTGEIIWRLGGKNNEFTFINDSIGFSRQHAIRKIENGNITLFDNGTFHTPPFSRAVEYRLDEVQKTATLVWQYRNSPDYYGNSLGYVQRLLNGNTLISWGTTDPNEPVNPTVTEVTNKGLKVFEMSLPKGVYTYRAFRSEWPRKTTGVQSQPVFPNNAVLHQNYPNPFNPVTTISVELPESGYASLKIYDVIGREIASLIDTQLEAGQYHYTWNANGNSSGVYFYTLSVSSTPQHAPVFQQTKKLVLAR
jgi:hypothetical protein